MHNSGIAEVFNRLADLLEIEGANPFRIRAYRNAARIISTRSESFAKQFAQGRDFGKIPGIGKDLEGKIRQLVSTGKLDLLEEMQKRVPPGLTVLLRIPGLGPKRVKLLRDKYAVRNIKDLQRILKTGAVKKLPGFGPKLEGKILEGLKAENLTEVLTEKRVRLVIAEQIADPLLEHLSETRGVKDAIVAGSYRRRQETVGDIDILVTCANPQAVMKRFVEYDAVEKVLAEGITRSTVILHSGIQVDLRVVAEESLGAALLYFTGSKAHNIAVRALGAKKGLKINEYGVYQGSKRLPARTEEQVYASVGLSYIEPELRENRGEVDAALGGKLSSLIRCEDIRGDLHAHTEATDGRLSIEEMAHAAKARGFEYLAITDHTKHLTVARGQDANRLRAQIRAIDKINGKLRGIRLLKAAEVDILEDGKLDLPDSVLKELDLTVCSVHYKFDLPAQRQTERIIRAMDNRYFRILGHPTGRLIQQRDAYQIDMERIITAARERGRFLELNSQTDRLDLNDVHTRRAKELGVKLVISTDAHSDRDFDSLKFGVAQARRGWIEKSDVLNTLPLEQLLRVLRGK